MPTYEYLCKSCGKRLEVQQRFSDEALTECPYCEGPLRKVFGSVGIAFKGSGFYKTDSRGSSKSSSSSSASSTSSDGGTSTPSTTESSSPSSESTPKPSDSSKSAATTTAS
jgi:putative FmdB family regulatory protein